MTIHGGCLCGAVRFKVEKFTGPFETCHCNRCQKVSGGSGMPAIYCKTSDYKMISGEDNIQFYEAPILYQPPAYAVLFCKTCGSLVPPANPQGEHLEIAAGSLDDDPGIKPDKHIFIEHVPAWDQINDDLPQFTRDEIVKHRRNN
jgi:hypothetical protein